MPQIDPNWEISVQDVKSMLDSKGDFLLLDVRQPDEYALCKISGAHLVPLQELADRINEVRTLAAGKQIVAHCHHGGRSLSAAALLRKAGLGEARSMAGGIELWSTQIDPSVPRY